MNVILCIACPLGTTHPCPSLLGYSAAAANVDLQTGESLVPTETTAPTQEGAIAAVEPRLVQVDNQVLERATEPVFFLVP